MSGGCYKFHLILKEVFGGHGYYDGNHVITMIDGQFYDVDGIAKFSDRYYLIGGINYPEKSMEKVFRDYL